MNLDDAQKQQVRQWIEQGLKLSEIQQKLSQDLGISMTYMELRFLIDDLRLQPKDSDAPAPADPVIPAAAPADRDESDLDEAGGGLDGAAEPAPAPGGGRAQISVDQMVRPGTMLSGKVTFADGQKAEWYLDQMGRLALAPQQRGYKPSQADILAFQDQLQSELARLGY
ncbi:MAG TPA: hypothetical protein P5555_01035 [Candidatus Paceibacterota bacterium]|nr:hypothetical protein [Verrucomicrobiota bacterium]HOX00977.1 hypothetical protein [Verrucomicrobiota bacterium]HRZ43757.1 hypothetical protein [Candidatus Paceibacterota bacterium]HRZ91352.1 hypothetical protein [Candidatus Paceibacterota bacterium]